MDRRCCCRRGCLLFRDEFNRPDNPVLGSSWYEPVGWNTAEIHGYCPNSTPNPAHGAVRVPYGSGPGAAIWTKPHPKGSAYMQGRIYTLDDHLLVGSGLSVELWEAVEYDPATHEIGAMHVARYTLSEPKPVISLFTRLGLDGPTIELADDEVLGITQGEEDPERPTPCSNVFRRLFFATLNSSAFCANISHAVLSLVQANPDWSLYGSAMDRCYSGFGLGALGPPADPVDLHVDKWQLWDVYDNNPICPYCGCGCGDYVMPAELTITVHGTGCMAQVEGYSTTLTWNRLDGNWQGALDTPCAGWQITLNCPAMAPPFTIGEFRLVIYGSCHDSDPCLNGIRKASPASTCDPLDLLFGAQGVEGNPCEYEPWCVSYVDLACGCCPPDPMKEGIQGCYWFEVTE